MPRLKKRSGPYDELLRLFRAYELDGTHLGSVIGKSQPTGSARLRNPGSLTLDELRRISRAGGIPVEELRRAAI